tara:strand:- start:364 stop:1341 length:978 start_codon:yes stop_codon:yes gene_type:complete
VYVVVKLLLCRRIKKPPGHKEGNGFVFFFFANTTTILVLLLEEFGRLFAEKSDDDEDHQYYECDDDDERERCEGRSNIFKNGKLPIDDELFKLRARDGTRGEGLPERHDDARRRRRREEEENNNGIGERAGRRGRRRRGIRATDAKETTGTAEKWYATTLVVFWRTQSTTDECGLFFSDKRKRERDAEENNNRLHSLARSRVFLLLLLLRRLRLPFLVYIITYVSWNTYFLITNSAKTPVRDGTARPRILQPSLGGRIFNRRHVFVFMRRSLRHGRVRTVQNSRQTLAKLESKVFQNQIYEGERAGLTVFYGKVKRKSSAVFDSV